MKILKCGLIILVTILLTACNSETLTSSELAIKKCVEGVLSKEDKNVECIFSGTMLKDDDPILADNEKEYFLYCDMDIERKSVKDEVKDQNITVIENMDNGEIKWLNSIGQSSDNTNVDERYEYCDRKGNLEPQEIIICKSEPKTSLDRMAEQKYIDKGYGEVVIINLDCPSGTAFKFIR